ncbi:MAG: hypothetical protein Ta2B_26610 [Termitinemataceae bacterium]|nr:MAG: hypothetical protein Ta2B_26610 [Termitinemataceae bacterium]
MTGDLSKNYRIESDDNGFNDYMQQHNAVSSKARFEDILDKTCSELQRKSAYFNLQKIDELSDKLKAIEDALGHL